MKKTVKMAICVALVAIANLFVTANSTYAADPAVTAITAKQVSAEQFSSTISTLKDLIEHLPDGASEDIKGQAEFVKTRINAYENPNPGANLTAIENGIKIYSQYLKDAIQADTTGTDYSSLLTAVDNTLDMWNGTVAGANIAARNAQDTATDAQTRVGALEGTVNDTTTGLAATNGIATDAQTRVGALEGTVNGTTGLTARVTALEGSLGTGGTGLASDVNGLKTTVGDENSGLVKKVNDHTNQLADHETRITANKNAIDAEVARSTAKDAEHDARLDNHETRITANTRAIANEVAERKAEVRRLDGRIDKEAQTRALVDQFLYDNIVEEANMRRNTDIALNNKIEREVSRLDGRINEVQSEARKGVALAIATANLRMPAYNPEHKWAGAIGYGNFKGQNAIAVGVFYQFNSHISWSFSLSHAGGEVGIGSGLSFEM